jgi:dTDP-4-amino-4,6-dideoxygalactose transaminase
MIEVPFNKPYLAGKELEYIKSSIDSMQISGDGLFTDKCHKYIENKYGVKKVLLTTSCTHALEMAFILINIKPGDEVIVPSYTFVSTVNAFVLRGARPIFIDIRSDTLNIDEKLIEAKISKRTKAICPVHYAGVGCEMDGIMKIARNHKLFVIEDAAQAINSSYKDKYLGTFGDLGAYSFHEAKNIICGEGGALLINDDKYMERAEIIREKGTDRSKYFRGEVDKYSWVDTGSSYLPSDILAAYLYAQLENIGKIQNMRRKIFEYYREGLKELENNGKIRLPFIPKHCSSNHHMFYIIFASKKIRDMVMRGLREAGIQAIFHYVPLHASPMGMRLGYKVGDLPITEDLSGRLLRLPFYNDISKIQQDYVINNIIRLINK